MAQRAPLWACCCILFAASFLVDIASAARPTLKAMRDEAKGFDYFMFVRQWPGSYCGTHACPRLEDAGPFHFTIHGLWPNYNDGTWPQFCDTSYKFDEDEVSDLEEALDLEWPSFMGENADFWDHEWSKHGTCALDLFPREHRFFKTVLKLHWKYDIAAALRAANILPSKSNTYKVSELADAVEDMYGARPVIHCYNKQLSEVWMCLDKDLKPFTCDSHQKDTCTEVSIPPLPKRNKTTASAAAASGRKAARAALVKAALLAEDAAAGGQDDFDALNRQLAATRAAAAAAAAVSDGVVELAARSQEAEPERVQTPDQLAEQRELDSLFGSLTASRQAAADMLLPLLSAGGTSDAGSGSDVAVNTQEPEPELQVDPVVAAPGDVVALGAEALAEAEAELEADGGVAADDSVFAFLAGAHKLLRGAVAAAAESLAAGAAASEQQQQRLAAVQQLAAAVAAAGAEERVSNAGESYATTGAAGAAVQAEAEAAQEVSAEAQAAAEAEAAELDVVSGGEEEEDEYLAGNMYVDWLPMAATTHAAAAAASSSAEAVVSATLSAAASIVSALANQEVEQQRELATGAAAAGASAGAGAEVAVGEGNQWDAWQREQEAHATELVQLAAARQAVVAAQHAQQLQADVLSGVLSALASRVGSLMQHLQQVTAVSEGAAAVAADDDEYETEGTVGKDSSMQAPREIDGLGLGGFVWTSRLRAEAHAAAAAAAAAMQEAEVEAAAAANGAAAAQQQQRSAANAAAVHGHSAGGAANRVSVAADGDGHLTWVVQHVVVLRGGAEAGGEGAGRRGGALDWVAMGQMLCATVLAVSLALLALLALARAVQTEQDEPAAVQQERQQAAGGCPVSWLIRGRRQRAAAAGAGSELAAPLLLAEEAGKAVAAASEEEEERVRGCSESLLRAGIIVVLPVEGTSWQQQQQQPHPYAATH